jgi:hypothetical protein
MKKWTETAKNISTKDLTPNSWKDEYEKLPDGERVKVIDAINEVLVGIASPAITSNFNHVAYAIAKGLAVRDPKNGIQLTAKGAYLANIIA